MNPFAWLLGISARRLVPLLLFAFAGLSIGLRYQQQMGLIDREVPAQEAERLRERLGIDQSRLDLQLGMEDRLVLRRLVGSLALHDGVEAAYLLDGGNRVLASLSRLDLGRPVGEVLPGQVWSADLTALVAAPVPGAIDIRPALLHPGLLATVPLQGGNRLLVWQDLARPLALQRVAVRAGVAREALVVLAAVGTLALMLHLLWFRRARRLAQSLAAIGAGDLGVRAGLRGRDELAHIGEVADRMAEQLQREQAQLRHMNELVNRSPAVVVEWRYAASWPVIQVSDGVRQWGYEPQHLLSGALQYQDLIHPDDRQRLDAEVQHYLAHGPDEYRQIYRLCRSDGSWAWVDDRTTLVRDAQGQVASISGVLLDITAQRAAEQAQREQAEQLRMFYELPFLGMAISSPADKRWLQVNDRLCEMLGYSREELLRMTWAEMTPSDDLVRNVELFDELLAGRREAYQLAKRFLRKDGGIVHAEIDVRALRDADGRVRQLFATIQDVTERKAADDALRQSQSLLLEAQRIGRMGSWRYDVATGLSDWTEEMSRVHGWGPETYDMYLEHVHPQDRETLDVDFRAALDSGRTMNASYRWQTPDGQTKYLRIRGEAIREQGKTIALVGLVQDETELVLAQRERERLVSVLETTSDIVSMADPQGRVFYFNRAGHDMLGLPVGTPLDDVIGRVHPAWAAQLVHEQGIPVAIRDGRWLGETAVVDATGREVPMSQLIMSHRGADGQVDYLWSILRDITERVQAAQALHEAKDMLEQAESVSLLGSWSGDVETQRLVVSAQLFRNMGLEPADHPPSDAQYLEHIHPEDRQRVAEDMASIRAGGEAKDLVFRTNPAHGALRWLRRTARRIDRSAQGLKPRYIGTLQDITDAVEAEDQLRQINQELEQRVAERTAQLSQANQELEAFSYSVSHDLKAPLRGIDGYSQLLVEEYGDRLDAEGRAFVARIRHGVQLMGSLISDLLEYSRMERRDMELEPVALAPLVQQVLDGYEADIRRLGVQVHTDLQPFTLALDREGIAVVLRNLIGNAIKFSRDSQPPRLDIGSRQQDRRRVLWVRDNGVGFDMKYHDRMFGIFQRLHRAEEFPGTGVGLALVAKAVQRMGGRVWAESAPGAGATFYLEFPE